MGRFRAPLISRREPLRFAGCIASVADVLTGEGGDPGGSPADDARAEEDTENAGDATEDIAADELEDGEDKGDEREDGADEEGGGLQGLHHVGDTAQVNSGCPVDGGGESGQTKDWQCGMEQLP